MAPEQRREPLRSLVKVPLRDGQAVLVEVEVDQDEIVRASRPGEVINTATESLDLALERLRQMAGAFVGTLRDAADRADEITVEFGIKVSAEARVVIAHTSGEANFKVAMKWNSR